MEDNRVKRDLPQTPVLQFKQVQKVYSSSSGGLIAVDGVSFSVGVGEIVALMGASGCGKTTLLRLAAGLEHPTSGTILFCEEPVRGPGRGRGIMFQEPRLFPWLTVEQNVKLGLPEDMSHSEVKHTVRRLLQLVGVEGFGKAYPCQLSGGMAQRVALARVLAVNPQLLLLDEPFSGLDIAARLTLQDAVLSIARQRNLTICLVTHDLEEAVYLADTVYVLSPRPGRIVHSMEIPIPRPRSRVDGSLDPYRTQLTRWLLASAERW